MIKRQIQHGDVLLHPIERGPGGTGKVNCGGRYTLKVGEATAHAHEVIADGAEDFDIHIKDGTIYLRVHKECRLVHTQHGVEVAPERREHATKPVSPGVYEFKDQWEHFWEERRRVRD